MGISKNSEKKNRRKKMQNLSRPRGEGGEWYADGGWYVGGVRVMGDTWEG